MRELVQRDDVFPLKKYRGRRMGDDELLLLRHWDRLDVFLGIVETLFQEFEAEGGVHVLDGSTFSARVVALSETWADTISERFSFENIWFVVATYLEARKTMPRQWSDLSHRDVKHLAFMLDTGPRGPSPVLRREQIVLFLRSRRGWGPAWYRPIPEA